MALFFIFLLTLIIIYFIYFGSKKVTPRKKYLSHIVYYVFEIVLVTTLIVKLFNFGQPQSDDVTVLASFKDYVFAYTIYQLSLLVTFKLKDSLVVDYYTSVKYLVDSVQLYAEFDLKIPDEDIEMLSEVFFDKTVSLDDSERMKCEQIIKFMNDYNEQSITKEYFRYCMKQMSLDIDMKLKMLSYAWMNSLLLRWLKDKEVD